MNIHPIHQPMSRRTLLKGTGAALALPWLEAMMPNKAQASSRQSPKRLACLFMPNGVRDDQWTPEGEGEDFKLSQTLTPLESLKDKLKKAYQDAGLKKTATGAQVTDYYTASEERQTINGKQVRGYRILGKKISA